MLVASTKVGDKDTQSVVALSIVESTTSAIYAPSRRSSRLKLRELDPFYSRTLKEVRKFVRTLKLVFALVEDTYSIDCKKTLYKVIFLVGELYKNQYYNYNILDLKEYFQANFKQFVFNIVKDPTNRSLSIVVLYKQAKQGKNQLVQAFAIELATLKEQIIDYTPKQRIQHLLAKLYLALRTLIIIYYNVPLKRQDLVSLATRLKLASKKEYIGLKRNSKDQQSRLGAKKKKLVVDLKEPLL